MCNATGPGAGLYTAGKPTSLTFRYTGSGCAGSNNPQGAKPSARPRLLVDRGWPQLLWRAAGNSSLTSDVYAYSHNVEESFEFTITFGGSTLKADSYVEIVGAKRRQRAETNPHLLLSGAESGGHIRQLGAGGLQWPDSQQEVILHLYSNQQWRCLGRCHPGR